MGQQSYPYETASAQALVASLYGPNTWTSTLDATIQAINSYPMIIFARQIGYIADALALAGHNHEALDAVRAIFGLPMGGQPASGPIIEARIIAPERGD